MHKFSLLTPEEIVTIMVALYIQITLKRSSPWQHFKGSFVNLKGKSSYSNHEGKVVWLTVSLPSILKENLLAHQSHSLYYQPGNMTSSSSYIALMKKSL